MPSEHALSLISFYTQQQTDWVMFAVSLLAAIGAIAASYVAYLAWRSDTYPDVVTYLDVDFDSLLVFFVVKNIGNGVAYDVSVSLSSPLPVDEDVSAYLSEGILGNGIPLLVPGAKRETYLCSSPKATEELGNDEIEATVYFYRTRWRLRRKLSAKFPLDMHSFHSIHVVSREKKALEALNKVEKTLNESRKAQDRAANALEELVQVIKESETN